MSTDLEMETGDDDLMAFLEQERKVSHRQKTDTVKLEKGEEWLIRLLPTAWGPNKVFWARIHQHWIAKKPYFCAEKTPEDFGGDPNHVCEMCSVAEELNADPNRSVSSAAYKMGSSPQWLMYCLVYRKTKEGQPDTIVEGDDRWVPYQFWLNRTQFDEVAALFKRYAIRTNTSRQQFKVPLSILDLEQGLDLIIRFGDRGLTIQRDEIRSIFDDGTDEDTKNAIIDLIWSKINLPTYRPLSEEDAATAAAKIREIASKAAESQPARRQNGPATPGRPAQPNSPHRPALSQPSRPTATASQPANNRPAAPQPSRPAAPAAPQRAAVSAPQRTSAPAAPQRSSPARPPTTSQRQASAPVQQEIDNSGGDQVDFPETDGGPAADGEQDFNPAPSQRPALSQQVRQASRSAQQPQRPTLAKAAPSGDVASTIDENDNVTLENTDAAPPENHSGELADPPPPINPPPSASNTPRLSDRVRRVVQQRAA